MVRTKRWIEENFLQDACRMMVKELDWDSLDSGRLHHSTSRAKTNSGEGIVIAALSDVEQLSTLLEDADSERQYESLPAEAPLWLYVPMQLKLPSNLPRTVVIKRLPDKKF